MATVSNFELIIARGTVGFHDRWATDVEDSSYKWENTLPFFKKSITFTEPPAKDAEKYGRWDAAAYDDGDGGDARPLQLCYSSHVMAFNSNILDAMKRSGFSEIDGLNSGKLMGVTMVPITFDLQDSTRSSSETAFLQPALCRGNLSVYSRTIAERVLFDENESTRAVGVAVNTAGIGYHLKARKEVIVSAGVVSTSTPVVMPSVTDVVVQIAPYLNAFRCRPGGGAVQVWNCGGCGPAWSWSEHDSESASQDCTRHIHLLIMPGPWPIWSSICYEHRDTEQLAHRRRIGIGSRAVYTRRNRTSHRLPCQLHRCVTSSKFLLCGNNALMRSYRIRKAAACFPRRSVRTG